MEDLKKDVIKKLDIIEKDRYKIFGLLSDFQDIFRDSPNIVTINKSYEFIKELSKNIKEFSYNDSNVKNVVIVYHNVSKINILFKIIKKTFEKIFSNEQQSFLAQTFLDKFLDLQKKINIILNKSLKEMEFIDSNIESICSNVILENNKESTDELTKDSSIIKLIEKIIELCKEYENSWKLYEVIMTKIIQQYENTPEMFNILQQNEKAKNYILLDNKEDTSVNYNSNNPPLYTYGLIPISKPDNIKKISDIIFKKQIDNIKDFENVCKIEKYDLLVIKKILERGISYNVIDLMNFEKSKEYEKTNSQNDGINIYTIERYNNISYIADLNKKKKWEISYKYMVKNSENKFAIVLEELYPDFYQILSNNFDSPFIRKNSIIEFFDSQYLISKKDIEYSRIHNYNRMLNNNIMNNMFLPANVDVDAILKKSQIVDAKYLRHEIYSKILDEFTSRYEKSNPKNLYEISKLVHDERVLKLFNQVMMDQFHSHLKNNMNLYESKEISLAEIYSSFIYTMNTYDRDFIKKIHDEFSLEIVKLKDLNKKDVINMFDKILKTSVDTVITLQSNIFQVLHYKLYLLNIPFSNTAI